MLCLGKILQNPESNEAWEQRLEVRSSECYRNFDTIDVQPTEVEWNIFPGLNTLQLSDKISLLYKLGETPETFTRRILLMSMLNDISCGTKDNEEECLANARLVSLHARRFGKGPWSFIGTFYQTRSNAIIFHETLPAYCIPKVVRLKNEEVLNEKVYMSPRHPPNISLKHEWRREFGSEVDRQPKGEVAREPEGEVARKANIFPTNPAQPTPNPICERSVRPENMQMEETRPVPKRSM